MRPRSMRAAFTLIELLVVIFIICILVALLIPAVQAAREAGRRAQCLNNLRQVGIGVFNYTDSYSTFPAGFATLLNDEYSGPGWGWAAALLPFMEQPNLYSSINIGYPYTNASNSTARSTILSFLICPSSADNSPLTLYSTNFNGKDLFLTSDLAPASYVGSAGQQQLSGSTPSKYNGVLFYNSYTGVSSISDGLSNTLAVGERSRNLAAATWTGVFSAATYCTTPGWPVPTCAPADAMVLGYTGPSMLTSTWTQAPNQIDATPRDFWGMHSGGCNFLFCDGSTRLLKKEINPRVFTGLSTRAQGEVLDGASF